MHYLTHCWLLCKVVGDGGEGGVHYEGDQEQQGREGGEGDDGTDECCVEYDLGLRSLDHCVFCWCVCHPLYVG